MSRLVYAFPIFVLSAVLLIVSTPEALASVNQMAPVSTIGAGVAR